MLEWHKISIIIILEKGYSMEWFCESLPTGHQKLDLSRFERDEDSSESE